MTTGWETKPLGEVCDIRNGLWKGKKEPFVQAGVIRNTNFSKDGSIDSSNIAYLDVESRQLEKRRLADGDIVLEKSGGGPKQAVGRVAYFEGLEGEFSFSNFTSAIRVLDAGVLDSRFLHRFLYWMYVSGITERMQSHSTGIRNLNLSAYKQIEVPLPPLEEQKRIVAILDAAFADIDVALANVTASRTRAAKVPDAYLAAEFARLEETPCTRELGSVSGFRNGFAFKSSTFRDSGVPVLRISNIKDERVTTEGLAFVDVTDYREDLTKYLVEQGDLLIAMSGATTGKIGFNRSGQQFLQNQRVGRFEPKSELRVDYLYCFLRTKVSQNLAISLGSAQPNLSTRQILELRLPVPPLEDQERIELLASRYESLSRELRGHMEQKQSLLTDLRQSLLHQAFTGQL